MHSFNGTILWTQAIIFQAKRVLNAHDEKKSASISSRSRIEEQFFLNACEKAIRWSEALSSEGRDPEVRQHLPVESLREFRKSMESTNIRNLREHEEEYLRTNGKSLEEEVVDASSANGGMKLLVEPGITVLRGGDIIIGGRVSVLKTVEIAEKFNAVLLEAQHKFAGAKRSLFKDANPDDYPHIFAPRQII